MFGVRGAGGIFNISSAASARIDQFALPKIGKYALIVGQSLGLDVGAVVPIESEPAKIVDGLLGCTGFDARGIDVLDAQDDPSAAAAGGQPGDQIGASVADVLGARGGRGQATNVGGAHAGSGFKDEGESCVMLYILIGYMFLFIHRPFEIWPALGEMHVERVYILAAAAVWLFCPGKRLQPSRLDLGIIGFCSAVLFAWMLRPWSDLGQPVAGDWVTIVACYAPVS